MFSLFFTESQMYILSVIYGLVIILVTIHTKKAK